MRQKRRETDAEYQERMRRFDAAKAEYAFYESGLGASLPNRVDAMHAATVTMWDNANAPAPDEYRKGK